MTQQVCWLEKQIVKTVRLPYLLFLPKGYAASGAQRWPLILFLHGAGERGDDLNLVKKHGIAKVVEQRDDFPCIAVSPQCPQDSWWPDHFDALDLILDETCARYRVDPDRLYLTGLSLGGYATWYYAVLHPDRFAALAPVCGGGMPFYGFPERVAALKQVPVWAFHGAKDDRVPLAESERLVKALQAAGGNVRLTVYPEAGHDAWTETYNNPELYRWLLAQTRRQR